MDTEGQPTVLLAPCTTDGPLHRLELTLGKLQIIRDIGMNRKPFESGMGYIGNDSQDIFVEPRVNRSHHRVVVRIHRITRCILPTLPKSCRSVLQHVAPTRIGRLNSYLVGRFDMSVAGQHLHQILRTEVTGRQVVVVSRDILRQIIHHTGNSILRHDSQKQSERVCCLIIRCIPSFLLVPPRIVERPSRPLRQLTIIFAVGRIIQQSSHLGKHRCTVVEISGRHQNSGCILRHGRLGSYRKFNWRRPVSVIAVLDNSVFRPRCQIIDPRLHAVVVIANHVEVTIVLITLPRKKQIAGRNGICRTRSETVGRHAGDRPRFILRIAHVVQKFRIEARQIEIIEGLLDPYRQIVHPSHPLVPLRAVGRNAVQVARLRGYNHLVDPVQQLVATPELARLVHRIADNFDDNIPLLRSLWQTFDLNISESMVGETGFPPLYSLTLEDIGVGCLGVPQIFLIDRTVVIKRFGELHRHLTSTFPFDPKRSPSGQILLRIEHIDSGKRFPDQLRHK